MWIRIHDHPPGRQAFILVRNRVSHHVNINENGWWVNSMGDVIYIILLLLLLHDLLPWTKWNKFYLRAKFNLLFQLPFECDFVQTEPMATWTAGSVLATTLTWFILEINLLFNFVFFHANSCKTIIYLFLLTKDNLNMKVKVIVRDKNRCHRTRFHIYALPPSRNTRK